LSQFAPSVDHLSMLRKSVLLLVFLCCQVFAPADGCGPNIDVTTSPANLVCGPPFTVTIAIIATCVDTSTGSITPTGSITLDTSTNGAFEKNLSSSGTVVYTDETPTGSYTLSFDYSGDGTYNSVSYGPVTFGLSSAALVFHSHKLQTLTDSSPFINIGYQYMVNGPSDLTIQYTVTVSYSCDNQGNGGPHEQTLTTDQQTDSVVASTGGWFPRPNQAWQYSFTLPASTCPTNIHIKEIQITMNINPDQAIDITVQTHISIPGAQTNNGNGNNGQPVTNLDLNSVCVVNSGTDSQCNQFSNVQAPQQAPLSLCTLGH